ncbi:hypothetical protein ASF63_13180 [Microbacterium sp. Leaf320]|nr:hypothetical protein ASF63_13180 [Microbacterium sp. Leaf320]
MIDRGAQRETVALHRFTTSVLLRETVLMRTTRFAPLLALPLVLAALAGCSPSAPTDVEPPKFDQSMNEVRDTADDVVDKLVDAFPAGERYAEADANAYACSGEDDGIGHWLWALGITSTDITGTIPDLQAEYGDAVTSTGTSSQDVEYSDGTTWPVTGGHTLIEDETGSYLLSYPMSAEGVVTLRVDTACGVLR